MYIAKRSGIDHTVLPANTPCLPFLRKRSPDVSGISSLCLFVNLIMAPVLPFSTHLFLHPSLLPLLIHHSVHL